MKGSAKYFMYPDNLNILDLASIVSMYRSRGKPVKAPSGEYYACCDSRKLIKEAKYWFGLYYSQQAWDEYLTPDSGGYPLTDVEMDIMAKTLYPQKEGPVMRQEIEESLDIVPQLGFLIINDLRQFGFMEEDESNFLYLTPQGEAAFQGIASRIFQKPFSPEMFATKESKQEKPEIKKAEKQSDRQIRLF